MTKAIRLAATVCPVITAPVVRLALPVTTAILKCMATIASCVNALAILTPIRSAHVTASPVNAYNA